ncbi:NACHT domain-containing protein [Streptomyces sp. NPDC020755]|uniref:NACHT domain-containing protein n=1 Tax=Streptomyces sp. NPDC020755 TaxID=3154790 RepID=UPI00340B300C
MGPRRPHPWWGRTAGVIGVLMVCTGAVVILRSQPTGDVDPFGALAGGLGAVIGAAGLVLPAWQHRQSRRDGAVGTLVRAVHAHEDKQYRTLLGPGSTFLPVRFRFSVTPDGVPPDTGSEEWRTITDRYLGLPGDERRLAVIGAPGTGKSLLAKELVRSLASRHGRETAGGVPVLLSLSSWNGPPDRESPRSEAFHLAFRRWLVQQVSQTYGQHPALVDEALTDDSVLVLDGLDELDPTDGLAERRPTEAGARPRAVALLSYLTMNQDRFRNVVITCRKDVYEQFEGPTPLAGAARAELLPVPPDMALDYLRNRSAWSHSGLTERWDGVLDEMRVAPEGPLARALSTPWRLTMIANAFHVRDEDGTGWLRDPSVLVTRWGHEALREAFQAHHAWYAADHGWAEPLGSLRSPEEQLREAQDSSVAEWMSSEAEEYLLSLFVPSVVAEHPRERDRYPAERVSAWLGLLATHRAVDDIDPHPPLTLLARSRAQLTPHQLWPLGGRRLVRTAHGALDTLIVLLVAGLGLLSLRHPADIAFLLPLILAVLFPAINAWSDRSDVSPLSRTNLTDRTWGIPNRYPVVWGMTVWGVISGGMYGFGVAVNIVRATPTDIPTPVWVAAVVGACVGVPLCRTWSVETYSSIRGSVPGRRHKVFLVCAALRGRLPLRLGRFLDWAHEGGLLRVDGHAYRFRHDEFEQYLWRSSWRPEILSRSLAAATAAHRAGEAATGRPAEAEQMLEQLDLLDRNRMDLYATCPDAVGISGARAGAALRAWADQLSTGTVEPEVNDALRNRAEDAVRRFHEAASRVG